jgi:hypothetical protein
MNATADHFQGIVSSLGAPMRKLDSARGVDRSRRPFVGHYIFFSSHILVVAFHVAPAFAQSASVFAAVTSPAKAGPVKASARATAKIEIRVFMTFSPLR